MAWGFRTGSYANNGAGVAVANGGTTTVTLGAAVSLGDLLLFPVGSLNTNSGGGAPTFAVSDSVNGSWGSGELATGTFVVVGLNARFSLWGFPNSAAGTPVITVTTSFTGGAATANVGAQASAFSGIVTASPLDTKAVANGTGGSISSGAVSPATGAASELMVACYWDAGEGVTLTEGNINGVGATLAGKHASDSGKWEGLLEYGDSGSSGGTPSATMTSGTPNNGWGMIAAVFKITGATFDPTTVVPLLGGQVHVPPQLAQIAF